LWAPWRIEYLRSTQGAECIFCASARPAEDGAGQVLERGRRGFTMLNAFPYASGHVMVAPYRHVGELQDLDDGEALELMQLSRRVIVALRRAMSPHGFNVGFNLGRAAGAGFADHLHLHVVPRWEGDTNFMPMLADTRVMPRALDATHDALSRALSEID
jgi:ATP adenylyltransferase